MNWTNPLIFFIGLGIGWGLTRRRNASLSHSHDALRSPSNREGLNNTRTPSSAQPSHQNLDELKEKLQRLEIAYRMAIEMGQFKAGFLARTSHELRSPLNSIMSLQQLILTDLCDGPEEERDFISQSYEASQKLLALLNETTNVSKLEEGTTDLSLEPLSLSNILGEVENLTHLQAFNRNLKLMIELPDPDILIMGDYRWLRQVLVNLLTTAIYQMTSGRIQVTTQVDSTRRQASILIEDERSPMAWCEPIDLLAAPTEGEKPMPGEESDSSPHTSFGLTLTLTQIMMEKMHGALLLLSTPQPSTQQLPDSSSASDSSTQQTIELKGTRIQCSLPLANP